MKPGLTILVCTVTLQLASADTLTLTTGEKLDGEIVAETPTEYQIRLANDDFTIIHVRPIPATNVTAVVRDTPEQKAARQDYETICRYRLHPNQEQPARQCEAAIAVMKDYLANHSDPRVRERLTAWQTELANVTNGLVKFQNKWMPPADKQIALRDAYRQAQVQKAQATILQTSRQLAALDLQFTSTTNVLVAAERDLLLAEYELSRLQDFIEPEFSFRPTAGSPQGIIYGNKYFVWSPPFWERYVSGEKVTVHPARANYQQRVGNLQRAVTSYRADLQAIENKRTELRAQLSRAEATLTALSK